jgi:SOS-response transcriptional repressor LexA
MLVKTEEGFTIKKVKKNNGNIELCPINDKYQIIKPRELIVIGEIIGTIKKVGRND